MDWLKSVKSFIFTVHLRVQGNDNHHEGTDSLRLTSPPIHQRRRLFSTRYESRAQPSFPWISSNPSTDLMIPRRTKEKSMKPSSSSSSSLLTSLCDDLIIFSIHFIFGAFSMKALVLKEKDEMLRGGG
ncbi:hypothetical protein HID58_048620 [Brassica napus]|uniref:Uncharacterized protein n=1 Tax=Brassica napus TaxID=3708 RepID=A0ABQ8B2N3_BRANA|nr:hypothetical protein HID58_048620 [Brassica napus]